MSRVNLFISSSRIEQKNALGSKIKVSLREPIDTTGMSVRLTKASIWHTFPNISASKFNNVIQFSYNGVLRTLTFLDGLYSFSDINESIADKLLLLGLPTNLITLSPDEATGRASLVVTTSIIFSITFSVGNNLLKNLLGFQQAGTYTTLVNTIIDGTAKASLNAVNNVYVNLSFAAGNSYFNEQSGSNIVASVQIDTAPGSQIIHSDNFPPVCKCIGGIISTFDIWLCDQTNTELLDLNGEEFTIVLEVFKDTA